MYQVLILGTGGFAEEVADIVGDCPGYDVAGLVESLAPERCAEPIAGLPVHWLADIGQLASSHLIVCAIGSTGRHEATARAAALGFRFATVVHPSAHVSSRSSLGEGTIVSPGVVVGAHTSI